MSCASTQSTYQYPLRLSDRPSSIDQPCNNASNASLQVFHGGLQRNKDYPKARLTVDVNEEGGQARGESFNQPMQMLGIVVSKNEIGDLQVNPSLAANKYTVCVYR